jgi:hypothetical protein
MFTKSALLSTLFVLPLFSVACGQPEASDTEGLTEDAIATTQSALCTDSGLPNVTGQINMGDVGGSVGGTSPTSTYGSAACSGRYVVEATNTAGKPNLNASVTAPFGLPQSRCSLGTVSMLVYGFNGLAWVQLGGEHTATGVWTPSPFGGPGACKIGVGIAVPNTYQRVRIAGKAGQETLYGSLPGQVSLAVSAHY